MKELFGNFQREGIKGSSKPRHGGPLTLFLLYTAGLLTASPAWAEESETLKTSTVTVSASRFEQDLMEVPLSVSVVDEKELERNPQMDVASQLENIPGLEVHGMTSNETRRIRIRGMSATRTLVIIDGVKQSELRLIDGSFFTIDPASIEKIEVIKGPASVLYGSDAIGGVINITTKRAGKDDKPVSGSIGMVYDGSVKSVSPRASIRGNIDGFTYSMSGSGIDAGNRDTARGELWHSGYNQKDFTGNLGYQGENGSVNFGISHYESDTEVVPTDRRGDLPIATDPWTYAGITTVDETNSKRTSYTLSMERTNITPWFGAIKFNSYYQQRDRTSYTYATFRNTTYADGQRTADTVNRHDSWGGSLQLDFTFDKHYLIAGFDFDRADFDSDGYSYNTQGALSKAVDERGGFQQTSALFLQDEWQLLPDLNLTLGLRQTWVDTKLSKYSTNPSMEDSMSDSNLVGSAGLVYTGIENFSFRGLFSQGYRNPNLLQLFMGSGTFMLPNPSLKPETSNNFELGVRYNNGKFGADLALYYNMLEDGISMRNVGPLKYQYINYDKVNAMGAELAVDYRFAEWGLTPYASLTLQRYETEDGGFKTVHNGLPSAWGRVGVKWEKELLEKHAFFTDFNVSMTSGAYTETRDDEGVVSRSDDRAGSATANISFGLEGPLGDTGLRYNTNLSLRNLLDKYYTPVVGTGLPEPGFHAVWSFAVKF